MGEHKRRYTKVTDELRARALDLRASGRTKSEVCSVLGIGKSELLRRFGGDPAKTEWQLAVEAGYDRVWDAGTELWRLDFSKSVC